MLPESSGAIGVLQHDPPPDEKMMIFVFKKDLTKFYPFVKWDWETFRYEVESVWNKLKFHGRINYSMVLNKKLYVS